MRTCNAIRVFSGSTRTGAEGRDRCQHLVKGRPDVPVGVSEMLVQITRPSAGVNLVPVCKAAPASGAVLHR